MFTRIRPNQYDILRLSDRNLISIGSVQEGLRSFYFINIKGEYLTNKGELVKESSYDRDKDGFHNMEHAYHCLLDNYMKYLSEFDIEKAKRDSFYGEDNKEELEKMKNRSECSEKIKLVNDKLKNKLEKIGFSVRKRKSIDGTEFEFVTVSMDFFDYERIREIDFFQSEDDNYQLSIYTEGFGDDKRVGIRVKLFHDYREKIAEESTLDDIVNKIKNLKTNLMNLDS